MKGTKQFRKVIEERNKMLTKLNKQIISKGLEPPPSLF